MIWTGFLFGLGLLLAFTIGPWLLKGAEVLLVWLLRGVWKLFALPFRGLYRLVTLYEHPLWRYGMGFLTVATVVCLVSLPFDPTTLQGLVVWGSLWLVIGIAGILRAVPWLRQRAWYLITLPLRACYGFITLYKSPIWRYGVPLLLPITWVYLELVSSNPARQRGGSVLGILWLTVLVGGLWRVGRETKPRSEPSDLPRDMSALKRQ